MVGVQQLDNRIANGGQFEVHLFWKVCCEAVN